MLLNSFVGHDVYGIPRTSRLTDDRGFNYRCVSRDHVFLYGIIEKCSQHFTIPCLYLYTKYAPCWVAKFWVLEWRNVSLKLKTGSVFFEGTRQAVQRQEPDYEEIEMYSWTHQAPIAAQHCPAYHGVDNKNDDERQNRRKALRVTSRGMFFSYTVFSRCETCFGLCYKAEKRSWKNTSWKETPSAQFNSLSDNESVWIFKNNKWKAHKELNGSIGRRSKQFEPCWLSRLMYGYEKWSVQAGVRLSYCGTQFRLCICVCSQCTL